MKRGDDILDTLDRDEAIGKDGKVKAHNDRYWLWISLAFGLAMALIGYALRVHIYNLTHTEGEPPASQSSNG
jgi:hypothetical protein